MLYLNDAVIKNLQPSWLDAISTIENAVHAWSEGNFSQPIKPYLRFGNPKNRIIAMPAYLGDSFHIAGIKWIASFPSNLEHNLPRAHSVTLLNDADTGKPVAMINSPTISGIRTAAVSGLVIRDFIENLPDKRFKVGIVGFGPIGQLHLQMLAEVIGPRIDTCYIFDKAPDIHLKVSAAHPLAQIASSWQEAYKAADIFITCTTSSEPYINEIPKAGSLHLNVSLRDYSPEILKACSHILVDDWDEVCRENTDIERTHIKYHLQKHETCSLKDAVERKYFAQLDMAKFKREEFCIFNPMGMALFDIAMAEFYFKQATITNQGLRLDP